MRLVLVARVNDELRQDSNTRDMHYKTTELVSWWSNMTLEPGDIITSGSPPGVAAGMKAPVWLKAGDRVDATVAELGTLTVHIVAGEEATNRINKVTPRWQIM